MFCPGCGKETSPNQKFCRSCGLGLERIEQAVNDQLGTDLRENTRARKEKLERWGMLALSVFGCGIIGLILYGIVYKMMFEQGKILAGLGMLGFLVMIACGLLSVVLFAQAQEQEERSPGLQKSPEPLPARNTNPRLMEPNAEALITVIEPTTDLLPIANQPEPRPLRKKTTG